ncbi:trk system potassium uptake protein TrkH [Butyrivibrio sp. ob235]|uniref:TrkH family potassium uptake protein n=1 Tax=Butyrivibrio sp. ob235 TaxID=1761780 RepID=UPI0008BA23BA|nr:TrkH family potassium uptake protein [Butyrivibrio sp. ob235]SEL90050.1 trk system potassium uptake protein TrkH [Butyrivibrio sp. ob235]
MNYKMIRFLLSRVLQITGILMMLPLIVAIIYKEYGCARMFFLLIMACLAVGSIGAHFKPKNVAIYAREGFVSTALTWILISMIGGLPFVLSGVTDSYVDAVFETISGFTTTGSTILTSVEMYYSVQFWRTFTHWVGGMGVLVFILAIMPMGGGYSMHLMRAESPGPSVGKIVPRVRDTAKILYLIYIGITVTQIILLMITGLNPYQAMTTTFATVGTGGFGITNSGANDFSTASQIVITIFMIMCGINFNVYYYLITLRPKEAIKSDEVKLYLVLMFGSASLIAFMIYRNGVTATPFESFHHSLFTVASVMTTTGFATLDFNQWPQLCKTLLACLMLLGACAGSTGGGFKLSRFVILIRALKNELIYIVHPKSVKKVYMDGHPIDSTVVKSVSAYLSMYVVIFIISILLISFDEFDYETNFTAVAATLNNIGPGLGMVGPTGNFSAYSDLSKIVLMFDMLAGRLELLPMLILLSPRTWAKR